MQPRSLPGQGFNNTRSSGDQFSASAVYAIRQFSRRLKSMLPVVVDSGATSKKEGEATANLPAQSPYTLNTESGPD